MMDLAEAWDLAYRVAVRRLHDHQHAEDVAQDTMVLLSFTRLEAPLVSSVAWCRAVDVYRAIHGRKNRPAPRIEWGGLFIDDTEGLGNAEALAVFRETRDRLPPQLRTTLELESAGVPREEMAKRRGVSVRRVARDVEKVRRAFGIPPRPNQHAGRYRC